MTWIEEYEQCDDCHAEIRLRTDGRLAYADVTSVGYYRDAGGDTDEVWRDGHSLVVRCPAKRFSAPLRPWMCGNEVVFTGEGHSTKEVPGAAPILTVD